MHKSVLVSEALEYIHCEDKSVVVDCTVGAGGHASQILKRLPPGGRLIGIDSDTKVLTIADERLKEFRGSYILAHENFRNFDTVLREFKIDSIDAMLFDLGMSSFQLDDPERGFSFSRGGALDMRMDITQGRPLWQVLEALDTEELGNIIRDLGQERYWRTIAKAIKDEQGRTELNDSRALAQIITRVVRRSRTMKIDPATRTFQALRIFINDELGALQEALSKVSGFLSPGGRVVVVSFHSLEDRIVKRDFKAKAAEGLIKILTKKPIRPNETEISENPRARSAKLRAAERL